MTNQDLIEIGFEEIHHFTIGNSVTYDLGRNRILSASSVGTPNEMIFICELGGSDGTQITDLVCIHNWDHDKYLTIEYVEKLIEIITKRF